jgi:hypothetical protein
LPLVLHILDAKLSPSSKTGMPWDPSAQSALKQHRLNILIEAMKTYQPQYDGVDWVSETIRHIVNLAQLDTSSPTPKNSVISDWTDILASQPSFYLRLALTMDLSLSKGRLPSDGDFPLSLRGLFAGGISPLRMLLNGGCGDKQLGPYTSLQALNVNHVRGSFIDLEPRTVTAIPSDEETQSPESITEVVPSEQAPPMGEIADSLFVSGEAGELALLAGLHAASINGMASGGLASFSINENSRRGSSDLEETYLLGEGSSDESSDWVDMWAEVADGADKSDRDTAQVLLDALGTGDEPLL